MSMIVNLDVNVVFGERLCDLRTKRGWTQYRLAHETGVSQATISYIESGQISPRLATLHSLRKSLGVPWRSVSWNMLLGPWRAKDE